MGPILANAMIIVIMLSATGAACLHLYKEKKRGCRCAGCSTGSCCGTSGSEGCKDAS